MKESKSGRLAAIIVPEYGSVLDGLISRGEARPARTGVAGLLAIKRVASPVVSPELIDDSRGHW